MRCRNCGQIVPNKYIRERIFNKKKYYSAESKLNTKFCSRQCSAKFKVKISSSKMKVCKYCSKQLIVKNIRKRFRIINGKRYHVIDRDYRGVFCSRKCYGLFRTNNALSKFGIVYCKSCGKRIFPQRFNRVRSDGSIWTELNLSRRIVCSDVCAEKYFIGQNTSSYIHGLSKYPYSIEFRERLKNKIRKREGYRCIVCRKYVGHGECHHIHYNKLDSRESVLVLTCKEHNIIANKDRDYWFAFFCFKLGQEPESIIC